MKQRKRHREKLQQEQDKQRKQTQRNREKLQQGQDTEMQQRDTERNCGKVKTNTESRESDTERNLSSVTRFIDVCVPACLKSACGRAKQRQAETAERGRSLCVLARLTDRSCYI